MDLPIPTTAAPAQPAPVTIPVPTKKNEKPQGEKRFNPKNNTKPNGKPFNKKPYPKKPNGEKPTKPFSSSQTDDKSKTPQKDFTPSKNRANTSFKRKKSPAVRRKLLNPNAKSIFEVFPKEIYQSILDDDKNGVHLIKDIRSTSMSRSLKGIVYSVVYARENGSDLVINYSESWVEGKCTYIQEEKSK